MTVLAADRYANNGALIKAVSELGWISRTDRVLDPTYGQGVWWSSWQPKKLVWHDILIDGVDFRHLPHRVNAFDAVAFDPPYVSMGGRASSGIQPFMSRFGLYAAPKSPKELREHNRLGAAEAYRVLRPGGRLLWKCMDYVSSGHLQPATYWTVQDALALGFKGYVDRFEYVGDPGPQPSQRTKKCPDCKGVGTLDLDDMDAANCSGCVGLGRIPSVQHHARNNVSTLFVFVKP